MSQLAYSLKTVKFAKRQAAPVIPIRYGKKAESRKQHGKELKEKPKQDLPLFYTRPIFKAKEHDPL